MQCQYLQREVKESSAQEMSAPKEEEALAALAFVLQLFSLGKETRVIPEKREGSLALSSGRNASCQGASSFLRPWADLLPVTLLTLEENLRHLGGCERCQAGMFAGTHCWPACPAW